MAALEHRNDGRYSKFGVLDAVSDPVVWREEIGKDQQRIYGLGLTGMGGARDVGEYYF